MHGCISSHHRFQILNVQNHHSASLDSGSFGPVTLQGKYLLIRPGRTSVHLVKEGCVSSEEKYHFFLLSEHGEGAKLRARYH